MGTFYCRYVMPWRKNTVDSVRPNSLSHTWHRFTFLLQFMEYPGWLAKGLCVSGHSVRELEEVLIIREDGCGFLFVFYYRFPPPQFLWLLPLLPLPPSWADHFPEIWTLKQMFEDPHFFLHCYWWNTEYYLWGFPWRKYSRPDSLSK